MGRVAGFEVDISHRPGFFEAAGVPDFLVSDSSVTTLMFNGLFRLPVGEGFARMRPGAPVGCDPASGATTTSFEGAAATSVSMSVAA